MTESATIPALSFTVIKGFLWGQNKGPPVKYPAQGAPFSPSGCINCLVFSSKYRRFAITLQEARAVSSLTISALSAASLSSVNIPRHHPHPSPGCYPFPSKLIRVPWDSGFSLSHWLTSSLLRSTLPPLPRAVPEASLRQTLACFQYGLIALWGALPVVSAVPYSLLTSCDS